MPLNEVSQKTSTPLITRRRLLITSAAAIGGVTLYSNDIARHELEVTHPTFSIRNLPSAFDGFRIAQISDLHLEEYTEDYFLRRVVRQVNALTPDLVLVTGDFISRGPLSFAATLAAVGRCAHILAELQCPLRYGILGNHDVSVGATIIRDHMEANGLPLLVNQHTRIERGGQYFYLAGLDDVAFGQPSLEDALPPAPDAPVLLMVHEPDFADDIVASPLGRNVDYMLSGHTHGGQVRIPGLPPLNLPTLGKLYPEGHYRLGPSQLYVNRGIGTVGVPFRLNCVPEITLATLRNAGAA